MLYEKLWDFIFRPYRQALPHAYNILVFFLHIFYKFTLLEFGVKDSHWNY